MVQSSLNLGWAILNAAGLSFIGLGVRAPQAEWGIMVSDGAANIFSGEWWMFVFPGAALMIAILTFSLCRRRAARPSGPETAMTRASDRSAFALDARV